MAPAVPSRVRAVRRSLSHSGEGSEITAFPPRRRSLLESDSAPPVQPVKTAI
jgi:hypothetical protein